jgi:NNP family nitrate/nitrite transporter-like MFS transporter
MLAPVIFLAVIFFVNFASRVVISPLLPAMELDLKISHASASALYLFVNLGFFAGLLCSGFVAARLAHRRVIVLSALAVGIALMAMLFIHSLDGVRLLFLILGMAAGLYLPSGVAAITALISPNHWGKALAFHEMAPVMAYVLSPLLAEAFLGWVSWQGVFGVMGLLSVIGGFLFARFGRGGSFSSQAPNLERTKQICANPSLWVIIFLLSLSVGSSMGVYNVMPLYLINEHGMQRSVANILLSLCRVSGLVLVNLAGWASDRLGTKRSIKVVMALGGLLTLGLGLAPTSIVMVLLFLQPMIGTCLFPAMMKAMAELFPAQSRTLAVALSLAMSVFLGGGAMPAGIGWLAESSSFGTGIAISGVIMLAGLFLLPFLNIPPADQNRREG